MNWDTGYFVKLYRSQSPDWLPLSPLTRGLFDELLLISDQTGRIQLGKAGLSSIVVPLRGRWDEVRPHIEALLADGCIALDGNEIVIKGFVDAQKRAKTSTERSRERRGNAMQRDATVGNGQQRSATEGNDEQRGATEGNGCNDKEQKEQKEKIPPNPPGVESEPAAHDVGESPTEAQMFRAYAAGLSRATGTLANVSRSEANAYALSTIWGTIASPAGQTAAEFLAYLPERVGDYVEDCRARGQNQRFEGGYSPKRFLDWLLATKDGSDPFPLAPLAPDGSKVRQGGKAARESGIASRWEDPTPEEIAKAVGESP